VRRQPRPCESEVGFRCPPLGAESGEGGFCERGWLCPEAGLGGHAAQYRVAEMKARQELAQMVRVRVESTNRYSTEDRAGAVSRNADVETRLQSSVDLSLESARVIEEWTDPQNGDLYIWLITKN